MSDRSTGFGVCQKCRKEIIGSGAAYGMCNHVDKSYSAISFGHNIAVPSAQDSSLWALAGGTQVTTRKLNKIISKSGFERKTIKVYQSFAD